MSNRFRPGVLLIAIVLILLIAYYVNSIISPSNRLDAQHYYELALEYNQRHMDDEAVRFYNIAIQLDPGHALALAGRCKSLSNLNRLEQALSDCTRAIELDGDSVWGYAGRCVVYSSMDEKEKAIADCTKALEIDPENGFVYNSRGLLYSAMKDYEQAISNYTTAITLYSDSEDAARVYYNRGGAYLLLGEYDLALADFETARDTDPFNFRAYRAVAATYIKLDKLDKALEATEAMIARFPDNPDAYYLRGWIYDSWGDDSLALQDYKKTVQLDASYTRAHGAIGNIYHSQGNFDSALTYYCQYMALANDPHDYIIERVKALGNCP